MFQQPAPGIGLSGQMSPLREPNRPARQAGDPHAPRAVSQIAASAPPLILTPDGRQLIERWIRAGTTPQRVVKRARIVLLASEGWPTRAIARTLRVSAHTVTLWRRRVQAGGPDSLLHDAPGRGRTATVTGGYVAERILRLAETTLAAGDRWSIRRLASVTGVSRASIHRILRAAKSGTSPSISNDPGPRDPRLAICSSDDG